jgi:serine/threonine-protein kinase
VLLSTARISALVLGISLPILSYLNVAFLPFGLVEYTAPWIRLGAIVLATVTASALTMAVTGGIYLTRLQTRRDVETPFWSRVWQGKLGTFAFKVARRLAGNRIPIAAMTHRATELSLGMAAENLLDGLPKDVRAQLGDLVPLIHRLQRDAQHLRTRYDHLNEAVAGAGDAGASPEYDDLREERDLIRAKLSEAVAALETIRLNLLRLHAGSGSIEGLTTHINLAFELSDEVNRLLEAREEVERGLAFPREIAATPV